MKFIAKLEDVEFEDLLPDLPSSSKTRGEHYIDIDTDSAALKLTPKEKKPKILNLNGWMTAWNVYMQALLYYKPQLFHQLFSYQKNFCELAAKYRFDPCYSYDKDFRLSLAAQVSVNPKERSARWDEVNIELKKTDI